MPRTSSAASRQQARRRLDDRASHLRDQLNSFAVPRSGWLRAIREALGMSAKDLAGRMHVTESTVVRLESSERAGTAQLNTLQRAADALGCDLVYALIPRQPLEASVQQQARRRARTLLAPVHHTMLLEDQTPEPADLDALLEHAAADWVDRTGLWDE